MDRSVLAGRVVTEGKDLDDILAHYGVKGMRWGVRREESSAPRVKVRTESLPDVTLKNGEKIAISGGKTSGFARILGRVSPRIRESINNSSQYALKDSSGKSVGELALDDRGKALNVVWVEVNQDQKGKGIATAVMKSAVDHAKKLGKESVTLEVPGRSPDARHIYEKLGFKEVGKLSTPEDDPYWGGLTEMELKLKGGTVEHQSLDDVLAHYGIKGMRWGVRRANPSTAPASGDHDTAKAAKAKVKAGGLKSLSNDELKTYLERMDLEKRYKKGNPGPKDEATKFIKDTLLNIGKQEAGKFATKQIAKALAGR